MELKTGQTFQKKVHFLKSGIYTGSLTVVVGTKPKPWFLVFFGSDSERYRPYIDPK